MESKTFKFKPSKFNRDEKFNCSYSKIIEFQAINKSEILKINNQLNSIEYSLKQLINKEKSYEKNQVRNGKKSGKDSQELISFKYFKTPSYEDYPKQLLSFYFTLNSYCSSIPILSIGECYDCVENFNNRLPDYLICAMLSKSSLISPIPQLYMKNIEYSNYYYELTLIKLNECLIKNKIEVYMIQALVILLLVDDSLNRYSLKCARLVSIIKLAQTLEIDNTDFYLNYKKNNLSPLTAKKLLLFIKYFNNETSKIYNLPKLVKFQELKCEDYSIRKNYNEEKFIENSSKLLLKNYYLSFKAYKSINFVFQKVDELDRDICIKSVKSSFKDAFKLIYYIDQLYQNLPSNLQYTINCLDIEHIAKNPLLRHQIFFYQLILKEKCLVYDILLRLTEELSSEKILYLAQKILNFNDLILRLLKDQQFIVLKSINTSVDLSVPIFYYYGTLQLNLIEKLTKSSISCSQSRIDILKSMAISSCKEFNSLITNLQPYWEGSNCISDSFTKRFEIVSKNNIIEG